MHPIFITGIGTGIGKTVIAAILTEALHADYWKPVQAGETGGTDSEWIRQALSNSVSKIHPETYRLSMAASPHIAARNEGLRIDLDKIGEEFRKIIESRDKAQGTRHKTQNQMPKIQDQEGLISAPANGHLSSAIGEHRTDGDFLIIEGAGGLLVPLNEKEFVIDLAEKLRATVILVSRNYLGSINHSLLTALISRHRHLNIAGWIFNDQYLQYEDEIVEWSGFPKIASVPFSPNPDKKFVFDQAEALRLTLSKML